MPTFIVVALWLIGFGIIAWNGLEISIGNVFSLKLHSFRRFLQKK